jgi:cytochrome oxidase Cu insertion factor (SCO1/SenC/PrrC family)
MLRKLSVKMMVELGDKPKNPGSGRKILIILAVIFVLPFTVAATMHLLHVKPGGRSYGDLVNPPRGLKFPVLHSVQGKLFGAEQWQKKWNVVTVDAAGCAEACQAQVYTLRQVHASLGKEAQRVQRVLLIPTEVKGQTLLDLQKKYPDLIILAGADTETVAFANEFNLSGQSTEDVYLVDPLGNLMMIYSKNKDPKGLRSDLTRLLKNSWAG